MNARPRGTFFDLTKDKSYILSRHWVDASAWLAYMAFNHGKDL